MFGDEKSFDNFLNDISLFFNKKKLFYALNKKIIVWQVSKRAVGWSLQTIYYTK